MKIPTAASLLGFSLLLSSCASKPIPQIKADRNGDGVVDAAENIQYTRTLDVAENGTKGNIADGNGDGIIDDLEYANWKNRQSILGERGGEGATGGKVLDTAYKGFGIFNMVRAVGGF